LWSALRHGVSWFGHNDHVHDIWLYQSVLYAMY